MSQTDEPLSQEYALAVILTARELEVLRQMAELEHDDDGELVYERGVGYLGLRRVGSRTVTALLRACAISCDGWSEHAKSRLERYHINETGKAILRERAAKLSGS